MARLLRQLNLFVKAESAQIHGSGIAVYPPQERKKNSTQVAKSANGLSRQPKKKPLNLALDKSRRHQLWQQVDESDPTKRSASKPPQLLVKCQRPSNVTSLQSSRFLSLLQKLTTSRSYLREAEQIPLQSVALEALVAQQPLLSLLRKASQTTVFSSLDSSRSQLNNQVSSLRSHLSAPKRMTQCASHPSANRPQETTASRRTTVKKGLKKSPLATRSSISANQRLPLTMLGAQRRQPLIPNAEPRPMDQATWMTSPTPTVLRRITPKTISFDISQV